VTEDDGGRWTGRRRGDGCPRRIGNFMDWTFRRRQSVWSVMAVDASRGRLDRDETASREYLPFRDGPFGACPWAVSPRRMVPKLISSPCRRAQVGRWAEAPGLRLPKKKSCLLPHVSQSEARLGASRTRTQEESTARKGKYGLQLNAKGNKQPAGSVGFGGRIYPPTAAARWWRAPACGLRRPRPVAGSRGAIRSPAAGAPASLAPRCRDSLVTSTPPRDGKVRRRRIWGVERER
jgi:hypothetical protein